MDKKEIVTALKEVREEFLGALEGVPEDALLEEGVVGQWSVKDMLAHIALWEAELVKLLWEAKMGATPSSAHFSKTSVDTLNQKWYLDNKERPYERVFADFIGVRKQTLRRIEEFKDEDLTNPRRFPWLKDRPLWSWIAGDSFEHESEHLAEIRAWREQKGY